MLRKSANDKMKIRLMRFVILIILLSSSIITILGNIIYRESIMDYAYDNMAEMQKQVQNSIDSKITFVSNAISSFGFNEYVQNYLILNAEENPEERLFFETKVRNLALEYSKIYKQFMNMVVISENKQYLSNDSYRIQDYPLTETKWYQQAVEGNGKPVLIGTDMGRNLKLSKDYSIDSYFSIVQAVYSKDTGDVIGVILVDWDIEDIKSMTQNITLSETGFIFIMDDKGQIFYAPPNEIIYRIRTNWFSENKTTGCIINGKKYNLIYNRSDLTGLTTVGIYDTGKTLDAVKDVGFASILIAVITIIAGVIYALVFSESFTGPIMKLSSLMKKVQNGDFSVRFNTLCASEEVKQLGESFNIMIDRINQLMELVYKEQKKKREAELKALQEQIKPHFLYNTLDTIQWMAKEYHAQDIVDMVKAMSSFFRVSLSKGKEYITLEVELSMIKSYLDIQSYRYEGMFHFYIDCEDEIKNCKVLRLTLQPIVENALYHGIKEADTEDGIIDIKCIKENENTILVIVEDNGAGMSQETCDQLNKAFNESEHPHDLKFYGTLNVNERIRITYGEDYGLKVYRRKQGGTRVEIRTMFQRGDK